MDNVIYSPSGSVSIQISEDKMSAWMTIHKTGKIIDENEVLELIKNVGICYGQDEALAWMAENGFDKDYEKPFPIAICKPSKSHSSLNYHFDCNLTYNPDAEWSWEDVRTWTFIQKDALLADLSINLFDEGGSIYNVVGELITSSSETIDLTQFIGANVYHDKANNSLNALVTGYPYINSEGKLCVIDELHYSKDIQGMDAPILLATSLTVEGSILGVKLSILKDLLVKGDIKNSEVYVEGNLEVSGNISECIPAGITVLNDIKVKSIFNSLVNCQGSLDFESMLLGSKVIADKQIVGNPHLSSVIGCHVQTNGFIDIGTAGDRDATQTELEITISPYIKERITHLTKVIIKLKENPETNAEQIEQIEDKLKGLEASLSDNLTQYLSEVDIPPRYIKTHSEIFKGVFIRVLKRAFTVKANQSSAVFYEED